MKRKRDLQENTNQTYKSIDPRYKGISSSSFFQPKHDHVIKHIINIKQKKIEKNHIKFDLNLIKDFSIFQHQKYFMITRAMAILMFMIEVRLRRIRLFLKPIDIVNAMRVFNEQIKSEYLQDHSKGAMHFLLDNKLLTYDEKDVSYSLPPNFEEMLKNNLFLEEKIHGGTKTVFGIPGKPIGYNVAILYMELEKCCKDKNHRPTTEHTAKVPISKDIDVASSIVPTSEVCLEPLSNEIDCTDLIKLSEIFQQESQYQVDNADQWIPLAFD